MKFLFSIALIFGFTFFGIGQTKEAKSFAKTPTQTHTRNSLIERVAELQKTARLANSGAFGCGPSDFSFVFPDGANIFDLLVLLEARIEANRTGQPSPMAGEVSDLVYAILSGLPSYKDARAIAAVKQLIEICGWAVIALLRMAEQNKGLRRKIEPITFPLAAINSAKARGEKLPAWISIKTDVR